MLWPRKLRDVSEATVRLNTNRLLLRPAILEDYAQWHDVRARNALFLKPFEPAWPQSCLSQEFFARRAARLTHDWQADISRCFLIFENNFLIGGINLNNIARGAAQHASLGYWLDEDKQGKGYMAEAARAVIDYAFEKCALARINAAALPHNTRSRKMLERLGFAEEGFAKAYIQINGVREDHVLYGLNAPDI